MKVKSENVLLNKNLSLVKLLTMKKGSLHKFFFFFFID